MIKTKETIEKIIPYQPGVLKPGAIKLASNENPLGSSPKALKAIQAAVKNASLYPDGACTHIKNKLAAHLGLKPENFIIGNGSDEVFIFAAGLTIEPGDNIVTSEVTFSEYAFSSYLFGGTAKFAPMREGKYQLNELLKLIDSRTRIVCIANPNNPTGTYVNQDELLGFIRQVPANVLVLVDEAYVEYVTAEDYPDTVKLLPDFPNLFITRTFSKVYGLAGVRLGYGIGNTELINSLSKTREPFNVNSLAQAAGIAALDDTAFVKKSIQVNETGKAFLYSEFSRLGLKYYPAQGNFIFVQIGMNCMDAFTQLMELGVTIRPMKSFGQMEAIRVTIGTAEQNKFFVRCLEKVLPIKK